MARIYQEGFETPLWDGEFKMNYNNYGKVPSTANTTYDFGINTISTSANTESYIRKIVFDEPRPNSLGKYSDISGGATVTTIYKKDGTIIEQDSHLLTGSFASYSTAILENKSASELEDIEIGYKLNAWSGLDG